ncbi:MAG: hypothetical protein ABL902_04200 [Gallionella sp.]
MNVIKRLHEKKQSLYASIEKRYSCSHTHRELRCRTIKDGRTAYYKQCTRCGNAGQAVAFKTVTFEIGNTDIPNFDDNIEFLRAKAKSDEYSFAANEINREFHLIYKDHLQSDLWKTKRTLVLLRARDMCEECKTSEAVEVHHKTYENLCSEPLEDLMAVCRFCHGFLHGKIKF